jgi:cytidylate kinase
MRGITIAIDGPAASGKSTTAAAVAEALGYCHLNSGQLYRAITWASLRGAWNGSENRFRRELERLDLRLDRHTPGYRVLVNGRDIGEGLVSVETSSHVSAVSTRKSVRDKVTVVFPDAELKVFLIASAEERGRRRLRDRGLELTPDGIRREAGLLQARDAADSERILAPLRRAPDAVLLDTTTLSPSEVVDRIVSMARRAEAAFG